MSDRPTSRRRRFVLIGLAVFFAVLLAATVVLRFAFHGERLAHTVTSELNAMLRGDFRASSIEWSMSHIHTLAVGGWLPITVRDLEIDDEYGAEILSVPKLTAEVDVRTLLSGFQVLAVRNLHIYPGASATIGTVPDPTGDHELATTTTNLLLAFAGASAPSFSAGRTPYRGLRVDLQSYQVDDADIRFRFDAFHGDAIGARAMGGTLTADARDPLLPTMTYDLAPTARAGHITHPLVVDVANVAVEHLRQKPPTNEHVPRDFEYKATADGPFGTSILVDGALLDLWLDPYMGEHRTRLTIREGGDALKEASQGILGGNDLIAGAVLSGPAVAPEAELFCKALEVRIPTPQGGAETLTSEGLAARLDFADGELTVRDGAHLRGAGGTIALSGQANLERQTIEAALDGRGLDVSPWLLGRLRTLTGGVSARGRLEIDGTFARQTLHARSVRLGEARMTGRFLHDGDGILQVKDARVTRGDTVVKNLRGQLNLRTFDIDLRGDASSDDLPVWARRFGLPRVAQRAEASGTAVGNIGAVDDLEVEGSATLFGVPFFSRVEADGHFQYPIVTLNSIESRSFGGYMQGAGGFVVDGSNRLVDFELAAKNIDLAKTPLIGHLLRGRGNATVTADGPLSWPTARVDAQLRDLVYADDPYDNAGLRLESRSRRDAKLSARLPRREGGGTTLDVSVDKRKRIKGAFSMEKVPLAAFLAPLGVPADRAGGSFEARAAASGTTRALSLEGYAKSAGTWIGRAFLGDAGAQLTPAGDGKMEISGSLWQGRVAYRGTVTSEWPPVFDIEVKLRRVDLELLSPSLALQQDIRGWVSGTLSWQGPLFGPGQVRAEAQFNEAAVVFANIDTNGKPAPVRLVNRTPLKVRFDGNTLVLAEPVTIRGPTGDVTVWGQGSLEELDFRARGTISAGLLGPYLKKHFERMSGEVALEGRISGSFETPRYTGQAEFSELTVKPQGQDAILSVPVGKVVFADDQLAVTGVEIQVLDDFSNERTSLRVGGGIRFRNFVPQSWALRASGTVGGKLLVAVLPNQLSAASGVASVSVSLLGEGQFPRIDGNIDFASETPLKVTPRGLRREILLSAGTIRLTDRLAQFEDIRGTIDDEGTFRISQGEVSLSADSLPMEPSPERVNIVVSARDVPVRIPGELELRVNVPSLRIVGGANERYEIVGAAELVDGRYVRKWQPILDALRPVRSTETTPPFYAGRPWLANAALSLNIEVRGFFVKNNIADIDMTGKLAIQGTPESPTFEGTVRVERGSFKFQGVRAKFTRTSGTVTFSPYQPFPDNTPTLRIVSESDYRDINGQDHVVTLTLEGPLANLEWDLSTAQGLNKGQTATLIFAGRTPEEARRSLLGDEAIGGAPTRFQGQVTTADDEGTLVVIDEVVKDLAGDFFAVLIEDPIRNFTSLDVARLELGTASISFRGEKAFTRSLRVIGEVDRSFLRGWSWDVRGEYRLTDSVSVDGELLQKNFDDDAEDDRTDLRSKVTWRRILLP